MIKKKSTFNDWAPLCVVSDKSFLSWRMENKTGKRIANAGYNYTATELFSLNVIDCFLPDVLKKQNNSVPHYTKQKKSKKKILLTIPRLREELKKKTDINQTAKK